MEILLKGARIVDKESDFIGDIYIKDGKIQDVGETLNYKCEQIDCEGKVLMPSFIDMHVHFRDPGFTHKEDMESGSRAALKGGYTFVNLMGNTKPIASTMEVVEYVLNKSKDLNLVDVHQCVSITRDFSGEDISHLDNIDSTKVKVITDDGKGIKSNIVMYNAMLKAKEKDLIVLVHAEDDDLTPIDYRISENIETIRDIYLSQVTGTKLHLTHVSTKEAIEAIRLGKKTNDSLTCDVTPHHIALWDMDYKVNPPIREKADVDEIIKGIIDGTVDTIGTDHAPHTKEDKDNGSPGMTGLETAFSICYTTLVKAGHIDLKRLSAIMSGNPSEIMNINKGRIEIGYDADLVLVDINDKIIVDADTFASKGKNTPFDGMEFYGEVLMTFKAGEIKYSKN